MASYVLRAPVDVLRQDDGSYLAMGRELPIFVVAPSLLELQQRIARLAPSISKYLEEQGEGALAEARRMGFRVDMIDQAPMIEGTVDVPILLSV